MPIKTILGLFGGVKPLTVRQGLAVLERDKYRCQYCGLDGLASFENYLVMTVDFVVPRARGGKKTARNLVAACRPCNVIKGQRVFKTFEDARSYVLQRREEIRKVWEERTAKLKATA
ncbi:MAG: HNH endonuclease [Bryobacteraceae bacterium]|jgi:5-methylcytosine-specific restriction endonuclease McrA|nr:HNH endonuclease [Bryobacteraceae bacterium]